MTSLQSLLDITPDFVTGLRVPVAENVRLSDASGAINIALRDTNPSGLLVYVQPYIDMSVGDQIDLRWGVALSPVATLTVSVVDQPVVARIPWSFVTPGLNFGDYDVRRVDGSPVEIAPTRSFLVKLTRPGGNDPQAGVPGHQGLIAPILPPDLIENGVGEGEAAAGVPLRVKPYVNMSAGDTIEVRWGAELFKWPPLTDDQVGQEVVIVVPEETILLGGDGENIPVCYRVVDRVQNYSLDSDRLHWSPNTLVDVEASRNRLAPPYVIEAVNGVIDLDLLQGADVTVEVVADTSGPYEKDDVIQLTWRGETLDGQPVLFTDSRTIDRVPRAFHFTVPYPSVSQLFSSRAIVSYVLLKQTGTTLGSRRISVQIKGNPLWLEPPVILDASSGVVPADLIVARVQIPPYSGMVEGDELTLYWHGIALDGTPLVYEQSRPVTHEQLGNPIQKLVANAYIEPLDGGRLDIWYRVSNSNGIRQSDPVPYKVGASDGALPAPQVLQAQGDMLDPYLLPPTGATLRIVLANIIEVNDVLTFTWRGSASGPHEASTPIRSLGAPLHFDLDRARYVDPNLLGTVDVNYRVQRNGVPVATSATLHLRILRAPLVLPKPHLLEAPNDTLDPMQAIHGATLRVVYESMDIDQLIGLKWRDDDSYLPQPGNSAKQVDFTISPATIGQSLGLTLPVLYSVVRPGAEGQLSAVLDLSIDRLPDAVLPRPDMREQEHDVLDVMALTSDGHVLVQPWPFIASGQRMWLRLEGTQANNRPWALQVLNGQAVSVVEQTAGIERAVALAQLKLLTDNTSLHISFKVNFDERANSSEDQAQPFPGRTLRVRALPELNLGTPTVLEAVAAWLNAEAVPSAGTTAQVAPYTGWYSGDQVRVTWAGPGGNYTSNYQIAPQSSNMTFTVPRATVLASAGQAVTVIYQVLRAGGSTPEDSNTLSLNIGIVLSLPAPQLPQASGGVLDPEALPGGAILRVPSYTGMQSGDQVTARWVGSTTYSETRTAAASGSLDFTVPAGTVRASAGRQVTVSYSVARVYGGSGNSPSVSVQVKAILAPLVWDTSPLNLRGKMYVMNTGQAPGGAPSGTSVVRQASGGQPPYSYASSNTAVATISSSGLIQARGNGSATLSVQDAAGQRLQASVSVSGVVKIRYLGNVQWWQYGGAILGRDAMAELWTQCSQHGGPGALGLPGGVYWTGTKASSYYYYTRNLDNGGEGSDWGQGIIASKYHHALTYA